MNSITDEDKILYLSFNQDSTCFAVGTEKGFKIYNTLPFKLNCSKNLDGGIGIIEMLYRCNILALVGGGKSPKFSPNKVILWDDNQKKSISELKFHTPVRSVKLKKDKIIIVCEQRIYVFSFQSFKNIDTIDTFENPKGLVGINQDFNTTVIAYPDQTKGYVRVKCYDKSVSHYFHAHESAISQIALNNDGTILATSSDKGTLIRLFHTQTGKFLQELRRGKDKVDMHFICFDLTSKLLAATSDKGTIHVWSLIQVLKKIKDEIKEGNHNGNNEKRSDSQKDIDKLAMDSHSVENNGNDISNTNNKNKEDDVVVINQEVFLYNKEEEVEDIPQNQSSIFKSLPNFLTGGFFKSDWSFAQLRLNEPNAKCTFSTGGNFIAITPGGNYYQTIIDLKKGGECVIGNQNSFK